MRKIKYSTMLYKKYTPLLWVSLLFILLTGCNPAPDSLEHSADLPFSITWQPEQPRAEQPIHFKLTLPVEFQPELSEVRGVTMYMGRIPLQWQSVAPGKWQATLLVGACSEANMQWQLTIPLRWVAGSADGQDAEPVRVLFTTVNN